MFGNQGPIAVALVMGAFDLTIPGLGPLTGGVTTLPDGTREWVDQNGQIIHEVTANDPNGKPVTFQEIIDANGNRRPNMADPATAQAFGPDLANHLSDPGNHLTRKIGNGVATAAASLFGLGGLTSKILTDPNAKATITSGPGSGGSGGGTGGGAGGGGGSSGGINTDAISAAAAASRAMSDQFLAAYNAAHPNQPPTMSAAQLPPAVQADMMAKIQASQAAGIGPIGAAQADALGPISASHATASLLDPTLQAEQRGRALGLEDQYGDVIAGKAPSVAYLQLMEALQKNESNQLGLASRASGGGNVALALRTSANNIGRLNQGASADAALLRAKEIADARTGLGGLIDQTRTGDINFADRNATLGTDVSKTNAGLDTNATLKAAELEAARRAANAGLTTGAATKDAELEAARRAANAGLTTGAATKDAELEAARRAANATALNTAALKQGELDTTAAGNNLTAALRQQDIDAAAKDAAAKNAIAAGGQVITGTVGAADAQARAIAAAQAAKAAQDAKDAALIGAGSAAGAKLLSGGSSTPTFTLPADKDKDKIDYGTNGAPILD